MPQSNFKSRATEFNTGVGKCSCGQTFDFTSEREMAMKLQKGPSGTRVRDPMHLKFCSKPPVAFDKVSIPKKAMMMGERQLISMKG